MPQLVIQNDQACATGRDTIPFADGLTPTEILMIHFPDGIDPETTTIYVRSVKVELGDNPSDELFQPLFNNDVVYVVNEVKGFESLLIATVLGFVIAAAVVSLLTPKLPGNVGQRKDSPNNNLQGQTNIARPYQAYPLVFGSPIVFPDLTGEPVSEYVNNIKQVKQLMNVGVGEFDITEIRAGETPLVNFTGSSSTIFVPVSKVVTVPEVTISFESNEIDGQELLGTNEGVSGASFNLVDNSPIVADFIGPDFVFEVLKDTESDAIKAAFDASVGDYIIELQYRRRVFSFLQGAEGNGVVASIVLDGTSMFYTIIISDFTGPAEDSPTTTPHFTGPYTATEKEGESIGPIKLSTLSQELWLDIIFQRGLKGTADIELTTQELDGPAGTPIGSPVIDNFSFTKNTLDQQFFTHKKVFPSSSFFQFTVTRSNQSSQNSSTPDQAKLEAVRSIQIFDNLTFGNNTLIEVNVPATINATSLRENKINLSLTSKLISYDVGTGNVITTTAASRKMADALLHLYVDFFGLDSNTLALDELYEIQNRLDAIDPRLVTFDFTFDDIDVSLDERMDAILNVARCFKWLDGDVYRFAREEERASESTLITRRDIASEEERDYSLSYNPQLLEAFDSVKVEFVDTATNKKAYIFRKVDPASVDPQNPTILDGVGKNPKTMQLAGCSEEFNAINRAELEIRKLIYQRYVLTDTGLPSMMLLDRGDMILYAEQYTSDLFDGEILNVTGNVATTSESIDFSVGTLVLHYMLDDGTKVGPFAISEIVGEAFKFTSTDLGQVFVRDSSLGQLIQTGSRYIIGQTVDLETSRWSVMEKEASGNNVNLTMITYDERIYDFD
jgi:hypothetical protein